MPNQPILIKPGFYTQVENDRPPQSPREMQGVDGPGGRGAEGEGEIAASAQPGHGDAGERNCSTRNESGPGSARRFSSQRSQKVRISTHRMSRPRRFPWRATGFADELAVGPKDTPSAVINTSPRCNCRSSRPSMPRTPQLPAHLAVSAGNSQSCSSTRNGHCKYNDVVAQQDVVPWPAISKLQRFALITRNCSRKCNGALKDQSPGD